MYFLKNTIMETFLSTIKKSLISIFFLFSSVLLTFSQPGTGWNLVFNDEFDGTTLDQTKWNYNYTWGRTHNHRAYMDEKQVTVSDGKLKITAIDQRHPNAPAGTNQWADQFGYMSFDYTSGAVNTNGKFNFRYGYIEGRFKMSGTGTWPAFWTLNGTGEWPPEIDILEVPHARTNHHYYYHYGPDWQNEASFGGQHNGVDKSAGFHTYGVEWGPDYMNFYFDGQRISTNTGRSVCTQGNNMYLIINLAVGGWSGDPKPTDVFPSVYECDWVRVWERDLNKGNWDFELGILDQWGKWNDVSVTSACMRSGGYGLQLVGSPASSERLVEVKPNTSYVFGGWAKVPNTANYTVFGVKDYGGSETTKRVTSTSWGNYEVAFKTGSSNTNARIYFYQSSGTGASCGDDFYLKEVVNDCNGVMGGTATIDDCGVCTGGNTGKTACVIQTHQAEQACSFDGIVESGYLGYEGSGYVNIAMNTGAAIEFYVDCPTTKTENLIVRYSNGGTLNRDCKLIVNGATVSQSVSFNPTGSWDSWQKISVPVPILQGRNSIKLVANQTEGGPNFDYFAVSNSNTYLTCQDQIITLKQGWNAVSFYVEPKSDLLAQLLGMQVQEIKTSEVFYRVGNPLFLNTLNQIFTNTPYLIYANQSSTFTINGVRASTSQVNLKKGFNFVSYSGNSPMSVTEFITNSGLNIIRITDMEKRFEPGNQSNTLSELIPGRAYFVETE